MAAALDDWQPVSAPAPKDDWQPVGAEAHTPSATDISASPDVDLSDPAVRAITTQAYGHIWDAFKSGYDDGFGSSPLGMSDQTIKAWQDAGMFRSHPGAESVSDVFRAFNEVVFYQGAKFLDGVMRNVSGAMHGAAEVAGEFGAPRDVQGIIAGEYVPPEGGAMHAVPQVLGEARELGVIGPERPPLPVERPAEAAAAMVKPVEGPSIPSQNAAAARTGDDVLRGPEPAGQPNAWRERFDQFVGKINTGEDAKQLLRDAADQNEEFPAARAGDIPLKQVEDLAGAAGVEPATVDRTGAGRLLQNDNMVRNAMQAMLSATDDVKAAAREVKVNPSEDNLMALREAMLRRDIWVEQVVGHRAEWGRTGNVFQEFMTRTKEEQGFTDWLKDNGETKDGLKRIADTLDGLQPGQVPKFLSDANKPTFWDKAMWYWVNALISGPVTHAKYMAANALFAGYEYGLVTPVAGAVGAARRAITGSREGVFAGEAGPRLWGLVAGLPDAVKAGAQAFKTGLQTPLPGELAQNIVPKQNVAFQSNLQPIPGWFGKVIGIPSRGASAIHSLYNSLGYRASIEGQAYRMAAKEGLSPADQTFWERRGQLAGAPTPEMMTTANDEAYRGTYISELGPAMKAVSNAVRAVPGGRLIMPFLHIPFNILARAAEGTPLAFLPKESRENLMGRNGAVKQDMAVSRMIVGGAVGAWAMNQVLNDRITGFGPTDPDERKTWLATGHQPYSVRIGDEWVSFNRFGSVGTMLGLYANLGEVIPHMKPDAEDLTKGLAMTVHSTGRLLEDEVGMQGLAGLMQSIDEPERSGVRYVSGFAGSWLPFSSALRQTASAMDPYMRETKSVVDGLRYFIPQARQGLEPKRDWLGEPIANSGFGFDLSVPGVSAIMQHRNAQPDPLALEMQRLQVTPTPPRDYVGGVKLTPALYDRYQAIAGALTRQALDTMTRMPNWYDVPPVVQQSAFKQTISTARRAAGAYMQARYPELIQAGLDQRVGQITGETPLKKSRQPPPSLQGLQ